MTSSSPLLRFPETYSMYSIKSVGPAGIWLHNATPCDRSKDRLTERWRKNGQTKRRICSWSHRLNNLPASFPASIRSIFFHRSHIRSISTTIMEVEVISKERIKPSSPTPPHLKTYKICLLDQLCPHVYFPFVCFYPNRQTTIPISDIITRTSLSLKQSLSQTLTNFYPFAGKIKDHLSVDCNDDGVYYVETRVGDQISKFLSKPDVARLTQHLLPHESTDEMDYSITGINVVMIQVNFFKCGGIALGIWNSHKIIDGHTYSTFLKAWADTAQGFGIVCPDFIASNSLFPQNPSLPEDLLFPVVRPSRFNQSKYITRRFLFSTPALTSLKAKAASSSFVPTRVEALTGLIWKCAISASKSRHSTQKPSVLTLAVNLRRKLFPLPSKFFMGNIVWAAVAQCKSDDEENLHCLARNLRNAKSKIDVDFVSQMQGEEGLGKVMEYLKEMGEAHSVEGANYYGCSSMCNAGMYDADFGGGKPIWVSLGGFEQSQGMNIIFLSDTRSGNGIEARVTLSEEDMDEFERDPEILAFGSLEPSPLELDSSP